jgi:outer membrane protein
MKKTFENNGPKRWLIFSSMALKRDNMRLAICGLNLILIVVAAAPLSAQMALTLEEAIRLSNDNSQIVKSAIYDSLSAISDLEAAKAQRFPTASLNATSYYINKLQSAALPFPGVKLTIGTHDNYQADLRVNLPLYTGGRISSQIGMQEAVTQSRGSSLAAQRLNNVYLTRKAYLGVLAAAAIEASTDASLERLKVIREDVQNLYNSGMADSTDLLDTELALERGTQGRDEKSTAVNNAKAFLARLTGLTNSDSLILSDSIPIPNFSNYENQRPADIERPELEALTQKTRAVKYSIGLSRAGYLPNLSGYGGYSVGRPNRNFFKNVWNDYWTAGLNLYWEFNLGGRAIRNVSSATQAANSAQMAKADLEQTLILQANMALANLKLAYNNFTVSGREFKIANRQYQLGFGKQQAGNFSVNRLLELETDLTSMEQLYKASMINYYISETEYLYAIGSPRIFGGF